MIDNNRRNDIAIQFLSGMLANGEMTKGILKEKSQGIETQEWYVSIAYQFADEIIKQSRAIKND